MREIRISVSPTGSAGAAAGTGTSELALYGILRRIAVDYTTEPATTDVTITEISSVNRVIITLTNVNTDGFYYPGVQLTDAAGATIAGAFISPIICGKVQVDVAQADAVASGVVIVLWVEEE